MNAVLVIPLKLTRTEDRKLASFVSYLERMSSWGISILVVDGSREDVFKAVRDAIPAYVDHIPVEHSLYDFTNDKVNGILTAVTHCKQDLVLLCDDDVRLTEDQVGELCNSLSCNDFVKAYTHFAVVPWFGWLDVARSAFANGIYVHGDASSVFGFRRLAFMAIADCYNGNCLFDNWELETSFANSSAGVECLTHVVAEKEAPSLSKFLEQRVRYAYEDLYFVAKTVAFASVYPTVMVLAYFAGPWWLLTYVVLLLVISVLFFILGYRKPQMRGQYPAWSIVFAFPWLLLRATTVYVALAEWLVGGHRFGDRRIQCPTSGGLKANWLSWGGLSGASNKNRIRPESSEGSAQA